MGAISFSIPPELASTLVRCFNLGAAIETGTNRGDTAALLSKLVPEVWTIELSQELSRHARERHRDAVGIHFITGDSASVLPDLAPELGCPALFWLDAHWCGTEETAGKASRFPLLDELAAIDASPAAAASCVLIDDAHIFLGGPPDFLRHSNLPSFIEVVDALRAHHERFVTVLQDVIIAVPPHGREVIEEYWRSELFRQREQARNSPLGRLKRIARAALRETAYTRLRLALRMLYAKLV